MSGKSTPATRRWAQIGNLSRSKFLNVSVTELNGEGRLPPKKMVALKRAEQTLANLARLDARDFVKNEWNYLCDVSDIRLPYFYTECCFIVLHLLLQICTIHFSPSHAAMEDHQKECRTTWQPPQLPANRNKGPEDLSPVWCRSCLMPFSKQDDYDVHVVRFHCLELNATALLCPVYSCLAEVNWRRLSTHLSVVHDFAEENITEVSKQLRQRRNLMLPNIDRTCLLQPDSKEWLPKMSMFMTYDDRHDVVHSFLEGQGEEHEILYDVRPVKREKLPLDYTPRIRKSKADAGGSKKSKVGTGGSKKSKVSPSPTTNDNSPSPATTSSTSSPPIDDPSILLMAQDQKREHGEQKRDAYGQHLVVQVDQFRAYVESLEERMHTLLDLDDSFFETGGFAGDIRPDGMESLHFWPYSKPDEPLNISSSSSEALTISDSIQPAVVIKQLDFEQSTEDSISPLLNPGASLGKTTSSRRLSGKRLKVKVESKRKTKNLKRVSGLKKFKSKSDDEDLSVEEEALSFGSEQKTPETTPETSFDKSRKLTGFSG